MAETGHARNVQHFSELIAQCSSWPDYKPQNTDLDPSHLSAKLTEAQNAIDGVTSAMGPWKSAVTARQEAFKGIRKLTTRVVNSFAVSGAASNAIEQAESFKRRSTATGQRRSRTIPTHPTTRAKAFPYRSRATRSLSSTLIT